MEHQFVYVETPKAGCSTIKHLLRNAFEAPPLDYRVDALQESRRDMFVHVRSNVPLPSLFDLDNTSQHHALTSPHFLRFCVVRNPYARILSAWRNKIAFCEPGYEYIHQAITGAVPPIYGKMVLHFERFVEYLENEPNLSHCNPHWRRQIDLLFHSAIAYNHVGKLENLSETINLLRKYLPTAESIGTEAKNRSTTHDGGSDLTEHIATRIFDLYGADFTTYGYTKSSWVNAGRFEIENSSVPFSRLLDEVTERNLVLSILYARYKQLQAAHNSAYRFSMLRAQDVFSRALRRLLKVGSKSNRA